MPFTLNPYIYCWDRPEDFEDNDGEWPTVVIGALVGGIVSGVIETGSQMVGAIQNGEKLMIDWESGIRGCKRSSQRGNCRNRSWTFGYCG